jgi:hypothetical protein
LEVKNSSLCTQREKLATLEVYIDVCHISFREACLFIAVEEIDDFSQGKPLRKTFLLFMTQLSGKDGNYCV